MIFRTLRLITLLGIAFVAGVLYERDRQHQDCVERAGFLSDSFCG